MAESNQFFYDAQVRRFIIQFIRIFSGWQVEYGPDALKTVPVMYGDPSRQGAIILRDNSQNALNTVPIMSAYVTDLDYDRKRIQSPDFIDKRHVRMRRRDIDTGELTTEQGNAFTIERHMPVPYLLKMKLDIWTSNTTQKLQLIEQIFTLFNPDFEIQSSDNYFDWTSLSTVRLTGNNWSSRSVPVGTSNEIDINTASFEIPIWISPPSKVKKLGIINRVVSSVYDLANDDDVSQTSGFDDNLLMGQRVRVTPLRYNVLLLNGVLTLFHDDEIATPDNDDLDPTTLITEGARPTWDTVFDQYEGKICPGISQISLLLPDEINEVTGTVTQDPENANKLLYTIDTDTIPANDLTAIDMVIDPLRSGPGSGLPAASLGQRYLLVDDIGDATNDPASHAAAWEGTGGEQLIAFADDIVEYDGTKWVVDFDASNELDNTHYVTNLTTQIQYMWSIDKWIKSYEGEYKAGLWQIIF